jgi:transcriptional regulator with XRE-family HTH domain
VRQDGNKETGSMTRTLTRGQLKARVLRALSGLSQEDFERETQVENIAGIESGSRLIAPGQVARMCASAGLTPESCETLIQQYEAHVAHNARNREAEASASPERRPVPAPATTIAGIIEEFEAMLSRSGEERKGRRAAEREQARGCWERAQGLSFEDLSMVARTAREFQSWALVELVCDESLRVEPGTAERARDLAGLAVEIGRHVRGSERWLARLRGFALAHLAKAQHEAGDPGTARKTFAEAERLWKSGEDVDQILDADRFPSLKASLKAR